APERAADVADPVPVAAHQDVVRVCTEAVVTKAVLIGRATGHVLVTVVVLDVRPGRPRRETAVEGAVLEVDVLAGNLGTEPRAVDLAVVEGHVVRLRLDAEGGPATVLEHGIANDRVLHRAEVGGHPGVAGHRDGRRVRAPRVVLN